MIFTIINNVKWFFKQISRSLSYAKYAWGGYDWDYYYSIDMFQYSLSRIAKHLSNEKERQRCETIVRLIDLVKNEYYLTAQVDEFVKQNGGYKIVDDIDKHCFKIIFNSAKTEEENEKLNEIEFSLLLLGIEKQKKAERILWKLIEHNIKKFWN